MKLLSKLLVVASLSIAPVLSTIAQGPPPHLPADVLSESVDEARVQYLAGNIVVDVSAAQFPVPLSRPTCGRDLWR